MYLGHTVIAYTLSVPVVLLFFLFYSPTFGSLSVFVCNPQLLKVKGLVFWGQLQLSSIFLSTLFLYFFGLGQDGYFFAASSLCGLTKTSHVWFHEPDHITDHSCEWNN